MSLFFVKMPDKFINYKPHALYLNYLLILIFKTVNINSFLTENINNLGEIQ